jgi:glycosyltransferase involved in cell wall biosynthesis
MQVSSPGRTRQRIVFVINSLEGGGAERVLSILLTHLAEPFQDKDVFLILLDKGIIRYPLPTYIKRIDLDCRGSMLRSILTLRRALRDISPHVVLSFLNRANCANILAARSLRYRCIISERVNTSTHFGHSVRGRIHQAIIRKLYPKADKVLAVSRGVAAELQQHYGVLPDQLDVIYNPYDLERLTALSMQPTSLNIEGRYIVSIGRLVPNKNFSLLVRAYHLANPAEKLVILGEGPEREKIQSLINALGLQDRIVLAGFIDNPYPIMRGACCAVFSSLAEGFPNAVAEAMALALPVIATDCDSGPAEILHDVIHVHHDGPFKAEYGVLVPVNNLDAMTQALRWLTNHSLLNHYRTKSTERVRDFSIERAVSCYVNALHSCAQYA